MRRSNNRSPKTAGNRAYVATWLHSTVTNYKWRSSEALGILDWSKSPLAVMDSIFLPFSSLWFDSTDKGNSKILSTEVEWINPSLQPLGLIDEKFAVPSFGFLYMLKTFEYFIKKIKQRTNIGKMPNILMRNLFRSRWKQSRHQDGMLKNTKNYSELYILHFSIQEKKQQHFLQSNWVPVII